MEHIQKVLLGILMVIMVGSSLLLVGVLVSKFGEGQKTTTNHQPFITKQEAIMQAQTRATGVASEVEFTIQNQKYVYEVELNDGEIQTEVTLDATTGNVISVEVEEEVQSGQVVAKITQLEARQKALAVVSGSVAEIKAKKVNGNFVYEVEIVHNGMESDVLINMMTGAVQGIKTESMDDEEDDDKEELVSSSGRKVTEEEAKKIALREIGGTVTDIEMDRDGGKNIWEVEVTKSGKQADVLIDLETGEVIEIEWEDEEDDD